MAEKRKSRIVGASIVATFVSLYVVVSAISAIHVVDFFGLSNNRPMSIALAVAFEIGAAASLASLIAMEKMNRWLVWFLFILLTLFQMMGNMYDAYVSLHDFRGWSELFGLEGEDAIAQKRILAVISGAILPIVALGFIKALVDYIRPGKGEPKEAEKEKGEAEGGTELQEISGPQDVVKDVQHEENAEDTAVPVTEVTETEKGVITKTEPSVLLEHNKVEPQEKDVSVTAPQTLDNKIKGGQDSMVNTTHGGEPKV